MRVVLEEIAIERHLQDEKWGEQNHPDGTLWSYEVERDHYRELCDREHKAGRGTWRHILLEEVFEALAEENPFKLRAELVQVAAVAASWVESIDRRLAKDEAA